ncbi:hypothetical protein ACLOJK_023993, partial [Asimina triloba]
MAGQAGAEHPTDHSVITVATHTHRTGQAASGQHGSPKLHLETRIQQTGSSTNLANHGHDGRNQPPQTAYANPSTSSVGQHRSQQGTSDRHDRDRAGIPNSVQGSSSPVASTHLPRSSVIRQSTQDHGENPPPNRMAMAASCLLLNPSFAPNEFHLPSGFRNLQQPHRPAAEDLIFRRIVNQKATPFPSARRLISNLRMTITRLAGGMVAGEATMAGREHWNDTRPAT